MWREPARLRRDAPLNLVFDGNSLVYSLGASSGAGTAGGTTLPGQVRALLATRFTDLRVLNCGIGGQTWANMTAQGSVGDGAGDVEAAYAADRTNVLVLWETTNSVCNTNRDRDGTVADAQAYVSARLASHPGWRIVLLSTLPRQDGPALGASPSQATLNEFNGRMAQIDAILGRSFRQMGCRAFVDVRCAGSPFALPDYTPASFARNDALWNEPAGGRVHLTDAGYAVVAGLVARAVANLAAR